MKRLNAKRAAVPSSRLAALVAFVWCVVVSGVLSCSLPVQAQTENQSPNWKTLSVRAKQAYQTGRYAEAAGAYEQVRAILTEKQGADHPETLRSMNDLSNSYNALGRNAEATKLYEETLALRRSKLGAEHPSTLSSMSNLANSYFSAKRFSEARDLRREALAIIDRMAVGYQELSREERSTALAQFQWHYNRFAWDLSVDPGNREELLNVTERGKARSLLEELTARKAIASSGIPAELSSKLSSLRGQLEFLDSKLSVAASNDERYGLRGERDRVRAEVQAVEKSLVADYPRYAAMTAVAPVSLQQGQALIPTGGTFISWMLGDKGWGVALTLSDTGRINTLRIDLGKELLLRASSLRWLVALSTPEDFSDATKSGVVSAWVDKNDVLYMADAGEKPADALSISPGRFAALRDRALASHGQWLSDKLLKPLEASINPAGKWILSPDGILAVLPWDVLPWYGQPLGAQKQITLVQSLSVYKLLKDRQVEYQRAEYANKRQALLAVGGAIYDAKAANETCFASRGRGTAIRLSGNRSIDLGSPAMDVQASNAFRDMQNIKPSNLPCSLDEVNSLNAIVG